MRKFLFFITSLCFMILYAQDYTPMLDEGKSWSVVYNYWTDGPEEMAYHDYQYRISSETFSFNGKEYRAIEHRTRFRTDHTPPTVWSNWTKDFYLFEDIDARLVYVYYEPDNHINHGAGEFLLYNFNLNVGDSVDLTGFNETGNENLIVAITNETVFGNENVKTYHINPGDGFQTFKIYEGIGTSSGLVSVALGIDYGWTLTEYGILNTSDFTKTQVKVYPNPFKDRIQIENSEEIKELKLFDGEGKLILIGKNQKDLNAKLGALKTGVYFLKIQTQNNQVETIKLIKNN